jgi:hypothetical protein
MENRNGKESGDSMLMRHCAVERMPEKTAMQQVITLNRLFMMRFYLIRLIRLPINFISYILAGK